MARGVPTTAELAGALRGFLAEEVMPSAEGRLGFMARVAANVAAAVEREVALGPRLAAEHAPRLAALGFGDDAELAAAIRAGQLDDRLEEVAAAIRPGVVARLGLWNPRYVEAEDAGQLAEASGSNTPKRGG